MTNLRQGRWLQAFCDACGASSSLATSAVAPALLGALLMPGAAALAASPSHTHRPLPTPLHSAHLAETASHSAGKKHKAGGRDKAGPHTEGAAAKHSGASGSRHSGKSKGRRTEPTDDAIPMYRVDRGHAPLHGRATRGAFDVASGRRHRGTEYGPAPLVTEIRHGRGGHPYAVVVNTRHPDREEEIAPVRTHAAGHSVVAEAMPKSVVARVSPTHSPVAPNIAARSSQPAPRTDGVYAEGISTPDDDERLPRPKAAVAHAGQPESDETPAPVPVVRATAGPPAPTVPVPATGTGVVQGFGAEVAVPAPDPSIRPGGTRRRSHPQNWTEPSAAITSEPLEDREIITAAAVSPVAIPDLYDRNGRLVMPAPLKGSHEVLVHQNMMADNDGLERIQDDTDLERLRAAHQLVTLPANETLHVNDDLPANRRVARPWTAMFAADIGRAFYSRFHEPIYVTSAARTVHYQAHLQMVNGNAAGLWGDTASPHLTGQAVDLAKRGMSGAELAWMRGYLLPLMRAGKIDVEEEFHQACFHVSVYRTYAAGRRVIQHEVAQVQHPAAPSQAAAAPDDAEQEQ